MRSKGVFGQALTMSQTKQESSDAIPLTFHTKNPTRIEKQSFHFLWFKSYHILAHFSPQPWSTKHQFRCTRSAQINFGLLLSCRAQKIEFIEGLTYKFLSKIKALQELQKNGGNFIQKINVALFGISLQKSEEWYMYYILPFQITMYVYYCLSLILYHPHFHFFKQPPRVGLRPTRGHGWLG